MRLDTTDPATLEAALEATMPGTLARVTGDGGTFVVRRVPGGWHLPGDLAVASADVAEGRPTEVVLLADTDAEALALLADEDPAEADALAAWAAAQRGGYPTVAETLARARALLDASDAEGAEAMTAELDDLDSVGVPGAGRLRDEIAEWLDHYGDDPFDGEDYR